MADLKVRGGNKLSGRLTPAGNKNSALPALCATLLTDDDVILRNFPDLTDVSKLIELLNSMGSKIEWNKEEKVLKINNSSVNKNFGKENFPLGMRGAILLLGPLLARAGHIEVTQEIGGCSLGIRELDPHLEVLENLGAEITTNGSLKIDAHKGLKGDSSGKII
jgi:UDP-N-acetylglucosamine 1-carboxyvinyltransferase